MQTLLTWSDRGSAGPRPSHHAERPAADRGPVLRLLEQPESAGRYDAAQVLTTPEGVAPARALLAAMREHVRSVELCVLDVGDPSDYEQLFQRLEPLVGALPASARIDVLLSAGTPQAQTLWVILVQAGLLRARMLQVIPPAFVPHPHPRAIREVHLAIEGFPEIRALREEVVRLRAQAQVLGGPMVGASAAMRELAGRIARVGRSEMPVLVLGETGTGKELVAAAVHRASLRASGPFIAENCGAFDEGVLASELFGHEKGAFTGAAGRRRGLFELAHGGTLFLDEVGELPPRVQVHLLRVLQEGTLRRVGAEESVRVDVRVLCATHRDLGALVREGRFREDLYYRLRGATLRVPPLRERAGDLEPLVAHFLAEAGAKRLRPTRKAWRALQAYGWPGNVRELRAEVLRWTLFCDDVVRLSDLAPEIAGLPVAQEPAPASAAGLPGRLVPLAEAVAAAERSAIAAALEACAANLSRTARALGIDRNTLKRKLVRLGLR